MVKHEMFGGGLTTCSPVAVRRCAVVLLYAVLVSGTAFIVCCLFRLPDIRLWCREEPPLPSNKAGKDSFLQMLRERERASYDRLMRYILRPSAPCLTPRALGGKRGRNGRLDGDKVICLEPGPGLAHQCLVYSFGISNEWSFDESIHEVFGCEVHAFDPSMALADHLHSEGIWFYQIGLGDFDGNMSGQTWRMRTLDSILHLLGHSNRTIDVLKMDIEGAEYVVLEDILDKGLLNHVNHLCVEVHLRSNPHWQRVHDLLLRVEREAGLRLFSTRNNTQVPPMRVPGFNARTEQHYFEMAWYRH